MSEVSYCLTMELCLDAKLTSFGFLSDSMNFLQPLDTTSQDMFEMLYRLMVNDSDDSECKRQVNDEVITSKIQVTILCIGSIGFKLAASNGPPSLMVKLSASKLLGI